MAQTQLSKSGEPLFYGYAERKITPKVPVSLGGYFNVRMWTGVLDDIYVQALALKQDDTFIVITKFDLISMNADIAEHIRSQISDIVGLNPDNVLLTAIHTHTAPALFTKRKGGNREYNEFLIKQAADAIHEATQSLRPGKLLLGRTSDSRFAFNRRYWMKSGEVVTNPPRQDPNIVKPEGPIDPEIGLIGIAEGGKLKVLMANIVNHCDTIGGTQVSADWPGFFRRTLEKRWDGVRVMPLIGAAGNINHFDLRSPRNQTQYDEAKRIGEGYAESAAAAIPSLKLSETQIIGVKPMVVKGGPREIDEKELAQAREDVQKCQVVDSGRDMTSEDLAKRTPSVLKYFADCLLEVAADRKERQHRLLAMRLGDAVLVGFPGEPFVEVGLIIKNEYVPGRLAFICSHSGANSGYYPNQFNFGRGGYETTPKASPNAMNTADLFLAAVKSAIEELLKRK